jgi:sRNA-binding regulator protein Hfq
MARRRVLDLGTPPAPKRGPSKEEIARKRAEELAASGMPYQMAMAVAHGRLELSEALERMARGDRVAQLMKRHDLSRALATQVALGHADLEKVLARKRFEDHRTGNRERSLIELAIADGRPRTLELHGRRRVTGRILGQTAYSFQFQEADGPVEEIHKLQVQAAWDPEGWKAVRKALKTDKRRAAEPKAPVPKPQDRYACSDKRLFRCIDSGTAITATLLEGTQVTGHVAWFSRFEFGVTVRDEAEVVVFRHALDHLKEG